MDREFLDLYDRELRLLYEQAAEFADEYPGIAGRLGGILRERTDPMVAGLLEGTAFLASRVQLKLKHEFPEFTSNLLEQLVPHYLAPTPSAMVVRIAPPFGDSSLVEGKVIARGSYLDAVYKELDRNIACRYRLCSAITLLPFELTGAQYLATPGAIQTLGVPVMGGASGGLRLSLTRRTAVRAEDDMSDADARTKPEAWFSAVRARDLPIHLVGGEADSDALYEQLFADCRGVYFRYLDAFGDPVVVPGSAADIVQLGFEDDDALLPVDNRVFRGFDLLREYFMLSRKFLGFRLTGFDKILRKLPTKSIDIVFTFGETHPRLSAAVQPSMFALYAAPAVNLFEMQGDRIPVRTNEHEFQIIPDRTRYLDYEPHRLLSVFAHYEGRAEKVPVRPLYSASGEDRPANGNDLFYTLRRLPRLRTMEERKYGAASTYTGTDMFVMLSEPATMLDDASVAELSVRALCSNRHLTEHIPVGEGRSDFRLLDDTTLNLMCIAGPTPPRPPLVGSRHSRGEVAHAGVVTWRLINMLSLNHLGLVEHGAGRNGQALREILSMFADIEDNATERRLRGIRSVDAAPIVRRIRQQGGIGAARGTEITVTLDDKAFEGTGVFVIGAVLDRFFCEYAAFNHFTQTVIRTSERGEVMRWPPRIGMRRPL